MDNSEERTRKKYLILADSIDTRINFLMTLEDLYRDNRISYDANVVNVRGVVAIYNIKSFYYCQQFLTSDEIAALEIVDSPKNPRGFMRAKLRSESKAAADRLNKLCELLKNNHYDGIINGFCDSYEEGLQFEYLMSKLQITDVPLYDICYKERVGCLHNDFSMYSPKLLELEGEDNR